MTLHAKTFAAREREAERKWMDERIADMNARTTIPQQAVEAADKQLAEFKRRVAAGPWFRSFTADEQVSRVEINSFLDEIADATRLIVGVQRPEDVARVAEAFERQFPQYKRDGFTGGDRQDYETLKAAILALPHTGQPGDAFELGYNAALTLTASHTGQPQEGEDWNRTQRRDGTWASDEPKQREGFEVVVRALKHAKADIDATIPYIGRLEGTPYGLLQTQRLLEEALLVLSAAPASPRAEGECNHTALILEAREVLSGLIAQCEGRGSLTNFEKAEIDLAKDTLARFRAVPQPLVAEKRENA